MAERGWGKKDRETKLGAIPVIEGEELTEIQKGVPALKRRFEEFLAQINAAVQKTGLLEAVIKTRDNAVHVCRQLEQVVADEGEAFTLTTEEIKILETIQPVGERWGVPPAIPNRKKDDYIIRIPVSKGETAEFNIEIHFDRTSKHLVARMVPVAGNRQAAKLSKGN